MLPVHPELVGMVREWTAGLKRNEPLFPKLPKRRTWLMVKKDLERVGIPYQTDDGIADFHAAGRHTHISELLRTGASVPEARKLARHSDIKMTMKYTHIGIEDQARALSALRMRCIPGVADRQKASRAGSEMKPENDKTPAGDRGFVSSWHSLTESDPVEAAGIEPASCEP